MIYGTHHFFSSVEPVRFVVYVFSPAHLSPLISDATVKMTKAPDCSLASSAVLVDGIRFKPCHRTRLQLCQWFRPLQVVCAAIDAAAWALASIVSPLWPLIALTQLPHYSGIGLPGAIACSIVGGGIVMSPISVVCSWQMKSLTAWPRAERQYIEDVLAVLTTHAFIGEAWLWYTMTWFVVVNVVSAGTAQSLVISLSTKSFSALRTDVLSSGSAFTFRAPVN